MLPRVLQAMIRQRPHPRGLEGLLAQSACSVSAGGCTNLYKQPTNLERLDDECKATWFILDVVEQNYLSRQTKKLSREREDKGVCKPLKSKLYLWKHLVRWRVRNELQNSVRCVKLFLCDVCRGSWARGVRNPGSAYYSRSLGDCVSSSARVQDHRIKICCLGKLLSSKRSELLNYTQNKNKCLQ